MKRIILFILITISFVQAQQKTQTDTLTYKMKQISVTATRYAENLSELIRRKVDLRTKEELSKYFRDDVVREAQVGYGREG